MAALTAIVIALAVAVGLNFLFTLAIVRRLRLQPRSQSQAQLKISLPAVGMEIPALTLEPSTPEVDLSVYESDGVIAFLSDNCEPCESAKAELISNPIGDPLLVFVQTSVGGERQTEFADDLAGSGARVVLLDPGSDLPKRFSVGAYPTFLRLRDRQVAAAGIKVADVRSTNTANGRVVDRTVSEALSAAPAETSSLVSR